MDNEINRKWASLLCQFNPKQITKMFNSSFCDHVISWCSILFLSFPTLHSQFRFKVLFRILSNCHVSNLKIVISKSLLLWIEIKNYLELRAPSLSCISVRSSGSSLMFNVVVFWFNRQHSTMSLLLFLTALWLLFFSLWRWSYAFTLSRSLHVKST